MKGESKAGKCPKGWRVVRPGKMTISGDRYLYADGLIIPAGEGHKVSGDIKYSRTIRRIAPRRGRK